MKIHLKQIFYDEKTRQMVAPGFEPLDNSANKRPDWYELWPMMNYLRSTPLEDNAWYGFFSPKFGEKTGMSAQDIKQLLTGVGVQADVLLISPAWDQVAYFLNPFEQGDHYHPGLANLTQEFLTHVGVGLEVKKLVSHSLSTVFSNYIVAKPGYWKEWVTLARQFFDYVEKGQGPTPEKLRGMTVYGLGTHLAPMKTFVQERLANVVLAQGNHNVVSVSLAQNTPLNPFLFAENSRNRKLMQALDLMKQEYARELDEDYMRMFYKLREQVQLTRQVRTFAPMV